MTRFTVVQLLTGLLWSFGSTEQNTVGVGDILKPTSSKSVVQFCSPETIFITLKSYKDYVEIEDNQTAYLYVTEWRQLYVFAKTVGESTFWKLPANAKTISCDMGTCCVAPYSDREWNQILDAAKKAENPDCRTAPSRPLFLTGEVPPATGGAGFEGGIDIPLPAEPNAPAPAAAARIESTDVAPAAGSKKKSGNGRPGVVERIAAAVMGGQKKPQEPPVQVAPQRAEEGVLTDHPDLFD